VLREHLHHPPVARKLAAIVVLGQQIGHPRLLAGAVDRLQPVRRGLVRTEHAEARHVLLHDVAQEFTERPRVFGHGGTPRRHVDRVAPEIGQVEVAAEDAAVGVWVRTHATPAARRKCAQPRHQPAVRVEQFLRPIAAHPVLEPLQVRRVVPHVGERHLVGSPRVLDPVTVDLFRPGPPLRRSQHDHRPARPGGVVRVPRDVLSRAYFGNGRFDRSGQLLVHRRRVAALNEIRRVAVAGKQRLEFLVADARQDRRVGDLVAVQVEDWQHRSVANRVEELVRMPRGRERAGLGLAVADDACDDQIGIVERHPVGVRQAVTELAALVDRAGRLGGDVAADVPRERELLEEFPQAFRVLALVRVDLRICAFEIRRPQHTGRAVAGTRDEEHVQVVLQDRAIQVHPHERQRGARAPVAKETMLDVLRSKRFAEEWVVFQVDHPHREVVAGAPVRVHRIQLGIGERAIG
jgi:hypothetical protein